MRRQPPLLVILAFLGAGCVTKHVYVVRGNVWQAALALPEQSRAGVPVQVIEGLDGREVPMEPVPAAGLRPGPRLSVEAGWLIPGVSGGRERSFLVPGSQDFGALGEGRVRPVSARPVERLPTKYTVVPRRVLKLSPALPYDDDHVLVPSRRRRLTRNGGIAGGVASQAACCWRPWAWRSFRGASTSSPASARTTPPSGRGPSSASG